MFSGKGGRKGRDDGEIMSESGSEGEAGGARRERREDKESRKSRKKERSERKPREKKGQCVSPFFQPIYFYYEYGIKKTSKESFECLQISGPLYIQRGTINQLRF